MTSDRKIQANRVNARASTGPRTSHGRGHSAKNAFRHGLSLPVQSDPTLSEKVQALARQIAGPHAGADIQMLARRVAEAEIDLCRVRSTRQQLLSGTLNDPDYEPRASLRMKFSILLEVWRKFGPESPLPDYVHNFFGSKLPDGPEKFSAILLDKRRQLAALDRYERRALSRRKFAIRDFDIAHQQRGPSAPSQKEG